MPATHHCLDLLQSRSLTVLEFLSDKFLVFTALMRHILDFVDGIAGLYIIIR